MSQPSADDSTSYGYPHVHTNDTAELGSHVVPNCSPKRCSVEHAKLGTNSASYR